MSTCKNTVNEPRWKSTETEKYILRIVGSLRGRNGSVPLGIIEESPVDTNSSSHVGIA